jgi:hypothetical protein
LFSDDDVLEPECVAAFYRTLAQTGGRHEVYRFNTVIVDAEEQMAGLNPPHPECEPWQEFAYHLFSGSRACTAQEVIFSRETYARQGGFVDFPLAWCSDYASLIAFADNKPIRRIAGPLVRFRKSGQNLSSIRNRRIALLKLGATMEFVEWMLARIKGEGTRGFRLGQQALRESLRNWFVSHLMALHVWLGPGDMFQVASFLSKHWPEPVWMNLARVTKSNLSALVQSLRRRLKPDHAARRSHPALHPQHCPSRWRGLQVERAISVGKGVACS